MKEEQGLKSPKRGLPVDWPFQRVPGRSPHRCVTVESTQLPQYVESNIVVCFGINRDHGWSITEVEPISDYHKIVNSEEQSLVW